MRFRLLIAFVLLCLMGACAPTSTPIPSSEPTHEIVWTRESSPSPEPSPSVLECESMVRPVSSGPVYAVRWNGEDQIVYSEDREGSVLRVYDISSGKDQPLQPSQLKPTPTTIPEISRIIQGGVDPQNIYPSPSGTFLLYRTISFLAATPTPIPDGEQYLGRTISMFYLQTLGTDSPMKVGEVGGEIDSVMWSSNSEYVLIDASTEMDSNSSLWILRTSVGSVEAFETAIAGDLGLIDIAPNGRYVLIRAGSRVYLYRFGELVSSELPFTIRIRYVWWLDDDSFLFLSPDPANTRLSRILKFNVLEMSEEEASDQSIRVFSSYFPSAYLSPDGEWLAFHGENFELYLLSLCDR